jgi:hypothetical protein
LKIEVLQACSKLATNGSFYEPSSGCPIFVMEIALTALHMDFPRCHKVQKYGSE